MTSKPEYSDAQKAAITNIAAVLQKSIRGIAATKGKGMSPIDCAYLGMILGVEAAHAMLYVEALEPLDRAPPHMKKKLEEIVQDATKSALRHMLQELANQIESWEMDGQVIKVDPKDFAQYINS